MRATRSGRASAPTLAVSPCDVHAAPCHVPIHTRYDRYGNRWSSPLGGFTFYGNNNRPDGGGNLLNDGTHTYQYDAENRLHTVDGGSTASYIYDAEGRRVQESVGGVIKQYVYGADGTLAIMNGSNALLQRETYFDGRYLGTHSPTGGFVYAYSDNLGTVRARSNGETDTSGPFDSYVSIQNGVSQIHFTGKLRDTETGLDYFAARYYEPNWGRFTTPDWSPTPAAIPYANLANPQSLNLYSYVLNNPVTQTDPDGHICCIDWLTNLTGWLSGATDSTPPPQPSAPGVDLISAQDFVRAALRFQKDPASGATYCNQATLCTIEETHGPTKGLTNPDGSAKLANAAATYFAHSKDWREVTPSEAQTLANQGQLVVGVWSNPGGHGHEVTARAAGVPGDSPIGHGSPVLNDVGGYDRVSRPSRAFRAAVIPKVRYYTPIGGGGR